MVAGLPFWSRGCGPLPVVACLTQCSKASPQSGSGGMSDDLSWLSAREMARRFAKGELSPVDVLEATLAQLHAVNPVLNAICLLDEPLARRLAAESAERW